MVATDTSATINSGGDKDNEISATERPTLGIDISNDINISINGDNDDSPYAIASQEPTSAQEKKDCSTSDIGNDSKLAVATTTFGSLPFSIAATVSDAKQPAENDNDNCNYNDNNTNDNNSRDADGNNAGRETIVVAAAAAANSSSTPLMAFSEEESVAELGAVNRDGVGMEEGGCSDSNVSDKKHKKREKHHKELDEQEGGSISTPSPNLLQRQQHQQQQQQQQQRDEHNSTNNSDVNSAGMCTNPSSPHTSSLPTPPQHFTHAPTSLPTFNEPRACMWTSSHAANAPSEDRSASLVNVILQPLPHRNFDSETQIQDNFNNGEYRSLIRLNLWSVIDGHGGGCVATYASEVLLPHIAASISRAMGCAIVSRGVCLVNGQLRDANALDLDGLIKSTASDRSQSNPNSIHYRSPYEATANMSNTDFSDKEEDDDHATKPKVVEVKQRKRQRAPEHQDPHEDHKQQQQHNNSNSQSHGCGVPSPASTTPSQHASPSSLPQQRVQLRRLSADDTRGEPSSSINRSESSVKTSVKTSASVGVARDGAPAGTHSPQEQSAIIKAITQSFLSVDEGWINSIDPVATHQTSCQSNGRWNSGACALTVMSVQRLEWTSVPSSSERENNGDEYDGGGDGGVGVGDGGDGGHDTSQNKDAARRRRIDHNENRALKMASSLSTVSSTSSLTTTYDRIRNNASGLESEITETEEEEDDHSDRDSGDKPKKSRWRNNPHHSDRKDATNVPKQSLISAPGGFPCHCYRSYDAMLYTAHVGDCRSVMLGSAPPRTINVRGSASSTKSSAASSASPIGTGGPGNQTDDESSHHSSDETECLSSSDHDADSSDDEDIMMELEDRRKRRQNNPHLDGATAVTKSTVAAGSTGSASAPYMTLMRGRQPARPRRSRRRRYEDLGMAAPYIALPPLESFRSIEIEIDPDYDKNQRRRHRHRNHNSSSKSNKSSNDDNNNDTINNGNGLGGSGNKGDQSEVSSSSSSSPSSQDSREFPPAIILPPNVRPIDLTTDHSAYNPAEVTAVLRRCNNAPRAISAGLGGGIKRVAGSLAVTRALGDAYLKTPRLSFFPYKTHTPYITARPEVNCRPLVKGGDKVLMLATDGVWERAGGEDVLRWVRTFYSERLAEAERRKNIGRLNKIENKHLRRHSSSDEGDVSGDNASNATATNNSMSDNDSVDLQHGARKTETPQIDINTAGAAAATVTTEANGSKKREALAPPTAATAAKRRKLTRRATPFGSRRNSTVADVIVRRVLNKVRRARNISSLRALMSLPPGRARRSKHDDITVCVVDLSAFIS
uniref:PPM-type phosphatase domain-containing protein n=2 Tax=Pseudo-nitzschia australis TaxID=44445 RepID=A0A7S4AMW9_9STRA